LPRALAIALGKDLPRAIAKALGKDLIIVCFWNFFAEGYGHNEQKELFS